MFSSLCKVGQLVVQRRHTRNDIRRERMPKQGARSWKVVAKPGAGGAFKQGLKYVSETAQACWSCTILIPHPRKITSAPITLGTQEASLITGRLTADTSSPGGALGSLDFIAALRFKHPSDGRAQHSLHQQRRAPAEQSFPKHADKPLDTCRAVPL